MEKHLHDHPQIEADLAYSEKLHGLATGHQQEINQLLDNMEQLQGYTRALLKENKELHEVIDAKNERIDELESEVADLQAQVAELKARPTTIYADQLVGVQHVEQQHVQNQLINSTRKRSGKNKYIDIPNQLELNLWQNQTTSL